MAKRRQYDEDEEDINEEVLNGDLVKLFSPFDWGDAKRSVRYGGKKKVFDSPERLWAYACQYFEHVENNPIKEHDFIKGGNLAGKVVLKIHPRPFTWFGFESFLWVRGVCSSLGMYKNNRGGNYDEYQEVLEGIGNVMKSQKFDGAAVGMFKEGIISREIWGDAKNNGGEGNEGGNANGVGNNFGAPVINVYYDGAPPLATSENDVDTKRKEVDNVKGRVVEALKGSDFDSPPIGGRFAQED